MTRTNSLPRAQNCTSAFAAKKLAPGHKPPGNSQRTGAGGPLPKKTVPTASLADGVPHSPRQGNGPPDGRGSPKQASRPEPCAHFINHPLPVDADRFAEKALSRPLRPPGRRAGQPSGGGSHCGMNDKMISRKTLKKVPAFSPDYQRKKKIFCKINELTNKIIACFASGHRLGCTRTCAPTARPFL